MGTNVYKDVLDFLFFSHKDVLDFLKFHLKLNFYFFSITPSSGRAGHAFMFFNTSKPYWMLRKSGEKKKKKNLDQRRQEPTQGNFVMKIESTARLRMMVASSSSGQRLQNLNSQQIYELQWCYSYVEMSFFKIEPNQGFCHFVFNFRYISYLL